MAGAIAFEEVFVPPEMEAKKDVGYLQKPSTIPLYKMLNEEMLIAFPFLSILFLTSLAGISSLPEMISSSAGPLVILSLQEINNIFLFPFFFPSPLSLLTPSPTHI